MEIKYYFVFKWEKKRYDQNWNHVFGGNVLSWGGNCFHSGCYQGNFACFFNQKNNTNFYNIYNRHSTETHALILKYLSVYIYRFSFKGLQKLNGYWFCVKEWKKDIHVHNKVKTLHLVNKICTCEERWQHCRTWRRPEDYAIYAMQVVQWHCVNHDGQCGASFVCSPDDHNECNVVKYGISIEGRNEYKFSLVLMGR